MPRTLPRNADLAAQFELLADLAALDSADAFRPLAYRRAAERIRESPLPVAELALAGKARQIPGVGEAIERKIAEYVETGDMKTLARLRGRVPPGLVDVMKVAGLGPKTARRLWQELGVTSLDDLRSAAESQRLRTLAGLGARSEERILRALAAAEVPKGRTLLGRALPALLAVVDELRAHPAAERVSEAGSIRRRVETVGDLDLIATASEPRGLIEHFVGRPWIAEVVARGSTKATVVSHDDLHFDLRVVPPHCYGNLLQHFTGSAAHNVALREDAVRRGLSVSEYGVTVVETGATAVMATEEELYAYLGYAWIPPELREDAGELEAARAGKLPTLVEPGDLRGDLHVHSDWSDGKATLEELAAAAQARGLEYLAICDHARRLRDGRLEVQAEAISELNGRLDGVRLLSGVEVDIRADGSLELDDEALAARDWVVASIHSGLRDGSDALTRRILAALENPHVHCIGHLTGRKINRRAPYELDLEAIFGRAAQSGTCLEINGQPDRLDLRDTHARAAAAAGVPIVLSSDAHSTAGLGYLELALSQARRAWLTARQVLNTRAWSEIQATRMP